MGPFASVDDLVAHLRDLGTVDSDEGPAFTELEHGLQTAAILADEHPGDDELIIAGLVHDLAHPWDGPGQPDHHRLGARAVRGLLGRRVAYLIEAHVDAKRYLVATDGGYRDALSPGSVATLAAQGGPLAPHEIAERTAQPDWSAALALRRADDRAKVTGAPVPPLETWLDAIERVARAPRP